MEDILVLFSSPHKWGTHQAGHTAMLLNRYLQQYKNQTQNEVAVNVISMFDQHLLPCTGCGECFKTGSCPKNAEDSVIDIFNQIAKSSHIVVASPIYFSSFPAPLKILIDRSEQFYAKKLQQGKITNNQTKTGCLVATCGSADKSGFAHIQKCCKQFFDCLDIAFSRKLYASNTDSPTNIKIFD